MTQRRLGRPPRASGRPGALSGLAGVVLVLRRVSRPTGVRVLAATVLVALLEVALTFALILAYSGTHPGWDLS